MTDTGTGAGTSAGKTERETAGTGGEDRIRTKGPLDGIVVADLSRVLAGPYCTLLLAELGARVIKIETPKIGDDARHYGPFIAGKSAYFSSVNRGKESIALNLKDEADRARLHGILAQADILVENFRPGTMERLGLGWDALHARHPRLIYAAASGFGHSGPYSHHAAYDMVVQGLGGIMSINGNPGEHAARVGISIGDLGAGLYTAVAVLAALYDRRESGIARKVDIGMFDCQLALLENAIVRYTTTGKVPGPHGTRHPSITPFGAFEAADGQMIISCGNDALFVKLAAVLGRPDLAVDPRFTTNDLRNRHVEEVQAEIEAILRQAPRAHWVALLEEAGIPCGPINTVAEAIAHPQVAARNMLVEIDDPKMGRLTVAGNPLKIEGFEDRTTRPPAPDLDGDRARILADFGLD